MNIEQLVKYLEQCDTAYYTGNPIVTNDTYDALVASLKRMEPSHPYLQKIGFKLPEKKAGRVLPMVLSTNARMTISRSG